MSSKTTKSDNRDSIYLMSKEGEDMLAKTKVQNKAIKKIIEKWEMRREMNMRKNCQKCIIANISRDCKTCQSD